MTRDCMKEQESWQMIEDVFRSINYITKMEERAKAYHKPKYDSMSQVSIKRVHDVSTRSRYVKPGTS